MKKIVKKAAKIIGIILAIFVMAAVVMFSVMSGTVKKDMANIKYCQVDMNDVADGTYEGETDTTMVKVRVAVSVKDHKMTDIKILKHENGRGAPAEAITASMIDKNTYEVDAVSGATTSSETIKSAVSVALANGAGNN